MMSGYVLNITAGSYPNMIEIEVLSQTAIAVGTYTNTINSANAYFFYGIYGTSNTQGGNQDTITITSINGTNVKGTFSGDVFSNTLQKSLTNGSFDVNF